MDFWSELSTRMGSSLSTAPYILPWDGLLLMGALVESCPPWASTRLSCDWLRRPDEPSVPGGLGIDWGELIAAEEEWG